MAVGAAGVGLGALAASGGAATVAVARATSTLAGSGAGAAALANKANHLFGSDNLARHNLGGVLEAFNGNAVRATSAIQQALQTYATQSGITDGRVNNVVLRVAGQAVTVRGAVIDGAAKLGTAFVPKQ